MSNNRTDGVDLEQLRTIANGAQATTHLFVASTGSDTNAGSMAAPLKTLAGAYALLPAIVSGTWVIHVASGSYAHATPPAHVQTGRYGQIIVIGDGAGQAGDDGFSVVTTGTVGSGSTAANVVNAAGGMTVDAMQGYTLEMLTGATAGCRRTLNGNGTTSMQIANPLIDASGNQVAAVAGATYRVIKPAVALDVSLNADASSCCVLSHGNAVVHYVQLALSASGAAPYCMQQSNRPSVNFGIELRNGAFIYGTTSAQHFGSTGIAGPAEMGTETARAIFAACGGTGKAAKWDGWGLSNVATTASLYDGGPRSYVSGYFSSLAGLGAGGDENKIAILGGRVSHVTLFRSGVLYIGGTNAVQLKPSSAIEAISSFSHSAPGSHRLIICGPVEITQSYDRAALWLYGNVLAEISASVVITSAATTQAAIAMGQNAQLALVVTPTITTTGPALQLEGNAQLVSSLNVTCTQGAASLVQHNASLVCAGLGLSGSPAGALVVKDRGFVETTTNSLSLGCSTCANPVLDIQDGTVLCRATMGLSCSGAGALPALNMTGNARLSVLSASGTSTITTPAQAFLLSRGSVLIVENALTTANSTLCSVVTDFAKMTVRGTLTHSCTQQAIALYSSAELHLASCTITGTIASWGAVSCQGGLLNLTGSGSKTIMNTSTAASSDGLRCTAGGTVTALIANPSITTYGSSGYGVNCRGGGRALFGVQPSNVVGPTADFTVGVGAGEDFPDTDLTSSFSSRSAGSSVIQRAA